MPAATHDDRRHGRRLASAAGYSLAEFVIAMGILTVMIGATLGGLSDVMKGNDTVLQLTGMNASLRVGIDFMVRDLLQTGSGLPSGHTITIPNGNGATPVRIPGPPGTDFTLPADSATIAAVIPGAGLGPTINGTATDVITVLMADNTFLNVGTTAVGATFVDVEAGIDLAAGADRVVPGQLIMIVKGTLTTLVEVTGVNAADRRLTFAAGDSLNLNQPAAAAGNLAALNNAVPANSPANTSLTRIRMITYYIDAETDPRHPRLVRRVNNGDALEFDNTNGTAVAFDIENLQFSYDISNGTNNPGNVEMGDADLGAGGACAPAACAATQVRKVNVHLGGRSANAANPALRVYRNSLQSQVSLRDMAFVDEYRSSF
jgi:hypothetical protein